MAKPSLLSRGALLSSDAPSAAFVPWFRDKQKLLHAVIEHAAVDPTFAVQVARAVGAMARTNRKLRTAIEDAAKAPRPGRQKAHSNAMLMLALDTYAQLRELPMPAKEAKATLARILVTAGLPLYGEKSIEGLLGKAKKLRMAQESD